jgi:energy-coupling factor transporter transmembrane protein EcfT
MKNNLLGVLSILVIIVAIAIIGSFPNWLLIGLIILCVVLFLLIPHKQTTSHRKTITWVPVLLILFALSFSPQQSKATTPRFTAIGWTKSNIDREQKRAIWKAKKHHKHHKKHRKVIKGNGRTMKVNRASTCPLSKR